MTIALSFCVSMASIHWYGILQWVRLQFKSKNKKMNIKEKPLKIIETHEIDHNKNEIISKFLSQSTVFFISISFQIMKHTWKRIEWHSNWSYEINRKNICIIFFHPKIVIQQLQNENTKNRDLIRVASSISYIWIILIKVISNHAEIEPKQ